jgi:mRNA-degrading endonuclease toxin of MazEF toxin-antitoxin module
MSTSEDNNVVFERGEIWFANLDKFRFNRSEVSSVQEGIRPVVVCQTNRGKCSPIVLIAPISAVIRERGYQFLQDIKLQEQSQIHYEQLGPISRSQLLQKIGKLNAQQMKEMDLRSVIPLGLTVSSILHINGVVVDESYSIRGGTDTLFSARMSLEFYEKKFKFSGGEFIEFFGPGYKRYLTGDLVSMSELLETLAGLKFAYNIINNKEASRQFHSNHNNNTSQELATREAL